MDIKQHPLFTLAVLAISIALFYSYFKISDQLISLPGPTHVRATPEGRLAVLVGTQLFIEETSARKTQLFDLNDWGITEVIGDFTFFTNGDLLIRGPADPALKDQVKAQLRIDDTNGMDQRQGILLRCDLKENRCRQWSTELSFARSFRSHFDRDNDILYIADTARHALYKLNSEGKLLAQAKIRGKWPNQLVLDEGKLFVTLSDATNPGVYVFKTDTPSFGDHFETINTANGTPRSQTQRLASDLIKVADGWWVNLMANGQKQGSVYVYDRDWHYRSAIDLPEGADPTFMTAVNDKVYIAAPGVMGILSYNTEGTAFASQWSSELEMRLSELKQRKRQYTQWHYGLIISFAVFLVGGCILGYRLSLAGLNEITPPPPRPARQFNLANPNIEWVPLNKEQKRKITWIAWILAATTPLLGLTFIWLDYPFRYLPIILLVGLSVTLTFFSLKRMTQQRIGVIGDEIVLVNASGKYQVGTGEHVLMSENHLSIDDVFVNTGNANAALFSKSALIERLYPKLKDAREVTNGQMQLLMLRKNKFVSVASLVFLVTLVLLVGAYLTGDLDEIFQRLTK